MEKVLEKARRISLLPGISSSWLRLGRLASGRLLGHFGSVYLIWVSRRSVFKYLGPGHDTVKPRSVMAEHITDST
jgi:hypothetical protein